jgi:hypothetical protein
MTDETANLIPKKLDALCDDLDGLARGRARDNGMRELPGD